MSKNCYVILGIRDDATQDEIKSAYRREAKKRHPDCSGEGSEAFLLVRDAYEVLSDPRQRRAHDEELARERRRDRPAYGARRPPIEPIRASRHAGYARDTYWDTPLSTLFEELFGGRWDESVVQVDPGRAEEVHAEVALTRRQALAGGRVRIWLPMQITCSGCGGRGWDGFFECPYCGGRGALVEERAVDVAFPGGVYDGFTGAISVRLPGSRDLTMVLHFRVDVW